MAGAWQVRLHIEVRGFRTFATRGRDQADSAWTGAAGALERHPQPAGTLTKGLRGSCPLLKSSWTASRAI